MIHVRCAKCPYRYVAPTSAGAAAIFREAARRHSAGLRHFVSFAVDGELTAIEPIGRGHALVQRIRPRENESRRQH